MSLPTRRKRRAEYRFAETPRERGRDTPGRRCAAGQSVFVPRRPRTPPPGLPRWERRLEARPDQPGGTFRLAFAAAGGGGEREMEGSARPVRSSFQSSLPPGRARRRLPRFVPRDAERPSTGSHAERGNQRNISADARTRMGGRLGNYVGCPRNSARNSGNGSQSRRWLAYRGATAPGTRTGRPHSWRLVSQRAQSSGADNFPARTLQHRRDSPKRPVRGLLGGKASPAAFVDCGCGQLTKRAHRLRRSCLNRVGILIGVGVGGGVDDIAHTTQAALV